MKPSPWTTIGRLVTWEMAAGSAGCLVVGPGATGASREQEAAIDKSTAAATSLLIEANTGYRVVWRR